MQEGKAAVIMMHSDAPRRVRPDSEVYGGGGAGGGGSGAERGAYAYTAVTVMVSAFKFGMLTLPGTGVSFVMLFLQNKSG